MIDKGNLENNSEVLCIGNQIFGMDDLVDYKDAAKILSVSAITMQRLGYSRKIPVYKLGSRTLRFLVADLCEYVDSMRIEAEV